MRMRKKKNGEARLEACDHLVIHSPEEMSLYSDKFPTYLEIGCGKGGFIRDTAKRNPDRFYIAAELQTSAIITALENSNAAELDNVRFVNVNALELDKYFKKGDIREIYLNFSDPWPKKGHTKRRLTYRGFLDVYKSILSDDGCIVMKTDNDRLFEFSLEEFSERGWSLERVTYDLHSEEWAKDNIMTEYEKNFSSQGIKIKSLVARPPKAQISQKPQF